MRRDALDSKRVLVTGGAGFLGSHLCDRLIDAGHEVLCVDNLFTGTRRNIQHLLTNPRFEFMRHDVCFPLYVEVDRIYNLACPASPIHYQHDPIQTTKTSVYRARCPDISRACETLAGEPGFDDCLFPKAFGDLGAVRSVVDRNASR